MYVLQCYILIHPFIFNIHVNLLVVLHQPQLTHNCQRPQPVYKPRPQPVYEPRPQPVYKKDPAIERTPAII